MWFYPKRNLQTSFLSKRRNPETLHIWMSVENQRTGTCHKISTFSIRPHRCIRQFRYDKMWKSQGLKCNGRTEDIRKFKTRKNQWFWEEVIMIIIKGSSKRTDLWNLFLSESCLCLSFSPIICNLRRLNAYRS